MLKHLPKDHDYTLPYHWFPRKPWIKFAYEYPVELVCRQFAGRKVLDVGCGDGRLTSLITERLPKGVKVLGVDFSPTAIEFAKLITHKTFPEEKLRFEIVQPTSPVPPGNFDLITMFDVIEHIHLSDVQNLMMALEKALNPTGTIIIITPNSRSLRNRIFGHKLNKKHFYEYNSKDIGSLLTKGTSLNVRWLKGIHLPMIVPFQKRFSRFWDVWFHFSEQYPNVASKLAICLEHS